MVDSEASLFTSHRTYVRALALAITLTIVGPAMVTQLTWPRPAIAWILGVGLLLSNALISVQLIRSRDRLIPVNSTRPSAVSTTRGLLWDALAIIGLGVSAFLVLRGLGLA